MCRQSGIKGQGTGLTSKFIILTMGIPTLPNFRNKLQLKHISLFVDVLPSKTISHGL